MSTGSAPTFLYTRQPKPVRLRWPAPKYVTSARPKLSTSKAAVQAIATTERSWRLFAPRRTRGPVSVGMYSGMKIVEST
eukprot:6763693-Prymnesium_polylepis.1